MERKFRWESLNDFELEELLKKLEENGILCIDDKIEIKVEADYSFSVVYTTDESNDSTDEEMWDLM